MCSLNFTKYLFQITQILCIFNKPAAWKWSLQLRCQWGGCWWVEGWKWERRYRSSDWDQKRQDGLEVAPKTLRSNSEVVKHSNMWILSSVLLGFSMKNVGCLHFFKRFRLITWSASVTCTGSSDVMFAVFSAISTVGSNPNCGALLFTSPTIA